MRWRRAVSLLCVVAASCLSAQAIFRATRSLADLSVFTGRLASVRVVPGMSRTSQVVFQFDYPAKTLGLDVGVGRAEAQQLAAQARAGKLLTVYYDASGPLFSQKVNPLSYQVELTGGKTIYPLARTHRRYWGLAALYSVVALLLLASASARNKQAIEKD